jgi:hypothetical protein
MAEIIQFNPTSLVNEWLTTRGKGFMENFFTGGDTVKRVTRFDDVNETLDLFTKSITRKILRGYDGVFEGGSLLEIGKLKIQTADYKAEFSFERLDKAVKAFASYMAGHNAPVTDRHLIEWLLDDVMPAMADELDDAYWGGKRLPDAPKNAPIEDLMDGVLEIAKKAHAAGNATMVTTDAVIDDTNAYENTIEVVRSGIHRNLRRRGLMFFCSDVYFDNFKENYKRKHDSRSEVKLQQLENTGIEAFKLSVGGNNCWLVPRIGIQNDNALIGTRFEWMAFGYNMAQGQGAWDVQKADYITKCMTTYPIGAQILMQREGALIINSNL